MPDTGSWQGISPGRTLEGQIVDLLGDPDNIVRYVNGMSAYHYYPQRDRCDFITVMTSDGIAHSVTEVDVCDEGSDALFAALAGKDCEPVLVEQLVSPHPVYAYPELGVAFEVLGGQSVQVQQHFVPVSASVYLAGWTTLDLRFDPPVNRIHLVDLLDIQPGVTTQAEVEGTLQPGTAINGVQIARRSTGRSRGGLPQLQLNLCLIGRCQNILAQEARFAFGDGVLFTVKIEMPNTTPDPEGSYPDFGPSPYELYTLGDTLRDYGEPALAFVSELGAEVLDLRLVYPQEGRQVTVSAATSETHTRCLMLNSAVQHILYFEPMSEESFRAQSAELWHDDFPAVHYHREIEWRGTAQFCELDPATGCLEP